MVVEEVERKQRKGRNEMMIEEVGQVCVAMVESEKECCLWWKKG